MKIKFGIITMLVSTLLIVCSANCFASSAKEGDYLVVLKEEHAQNSEVLGLLEPLWADARMYILKDESKIDLVLPYAESIEKDKAIEVVFEDPDPVLFTEPVDANFKNQWNHTMINVKASRDIENYGEGVVVGVIDSGCYAHSDLADNLLDGREYISGSKTTDVTDNVGHGTHVSGIIAASMNKINVCGVAPKAKIVPLKAFDTGFSTMSSTLATAIKEAVNVFGCDVINMSWGMSSNNSYVRTAINHAAEQGVILVASAGNAEGSNSPKAISYPAYYSNVISVAALTSSGTRASYSYYNSGVTVSAPGSSVYSTYKNGSMAYMTGTSQAAPHVAGIAALALSINPNLTKTQFEEILTSTCTDLGDAGRDDYYGHGLVNVDAMIEKIMEDVPLYISPMHETGETSCFHIRNNTNTPIVATNIFTSYSGPELQNISATNINLKKGEGITVSVDFDYTKHFVWKSFGNPVPMKELKNKIQNAIN